MGAGNVSIVKVGESDEEKATLLRAVGLNEATIRHCVPGYMGQPQTGKDSSSHEMGVKIPVVAEKEYGNRTPIHWQMRPVKC